MSRKKVIGTCHICGIDGKLSYEHVPPKAAFNDQKIMRYTLEQLYDKGPNEYPDKGGQQQQGGAGGHTLCERCNNNTGKWYAKDFAVWSGQGMGYLLDTGGKPPYINLPFYISPLNVIKQIVTMFFSVNSSGFREAHPELERFVLNPETKYLPPETKIYCGFMTGTVARSSGVSAQGKMSSSGFRIIAMSEIAFPPFVYVMTHNTPPPDERLLDISWFSRYDYKEFQVVYPKMNVMPVVFYLPGDYRTEKQIMEDYIRNTTEQLE